MKVTELALRRAIRRSLIQVHNPVSLNENAPLAVGKWIYNGILRRVGMKYDDAADMYMDIGKVGEGKRGSALIVGGTIGGGGVLAYDALDQIVQMATGESAAGLLRMWSEGRVKGEYHVWSACSKDYYKAVDKMAADDSGADAWFADEFSVPGVSPINIWIGGANAHEGGAAALTWYPDDITYIAADDRPWYRIPVIGDAPELNQEEINRMDKMILRLKGVDNLSLYDLSWAARGLDDNIASSMVNALLIIGNLGSQRGALGDILGTGKSRTAIEEFRDYVMGIPEFYLTYENSISGMVKSIPIHGSASQPAITDISGNLIRLLSEADIRKDMFDTAIHERSGEAAQASPEVDEEEADIQYEYLPEGNKVATLKLYQDLLNYTGTTGPGLVSAMQDYINTQELSRDEPRALRAAAIHMGASFGASRQEIRNGAMDNINGLVTKYGAYDANNKSGLVTFYNVLNAL